MISARCAQNAPHAKGSIFSRLRRAASFFQLLRTKHYFRHCEKIPIFPLSSPRDFFFRGPEFLSSLDRRPSRRLRLSGYKFSGWRRD
ncbi:MAG: hypothetical protein EBY32_15840 [Proteobacteria bacterium]|nr:hypothetical protein [Pseudomonadota bacterium]